MQKNTNREIIREELGEMQITEFLNYRDLLRVLYERCKSRIEKYSYLKFAEDLGFSATNVVRLIIIGERTLTLKAAAKLTRNLEIHGSQRRYLTSLISYNNSRKPAEREKYFKQVLAYKMKSDPKKMTDYQIAYFSEWYHPVIREVINLKGFDGTPEWIQRKLAFPLRLEEIKAALSTLLEIGVIKMDEAKGKYISNVRNIVTESEIDALAIVRYHQKMIEIAKESITRVDEKKRDIRALTVALPASAIPGLKAKIQEFLLETLELESADSSEEVYQMNIQLFPFTENGR